MTVYYTGNGCFVTSNELYHHGVKGMKWGRRKARPQSTVDRNSPEAKAARKAKAVKAAKIGAAVAGTALAAYGAYKLTKFVKNKNVELATQRGEELARKYISDNKYTVGWDGTGGIIAKQGGQTVGRAFGTRNDAEMRNAAKAYAGLNRVNYNTAQGIKSRTIRDATRDSLGTAAKNVGSHYANKAKTAVTSSKVGKSVSSMKLKAEATRAVNKAAKEARERARDEYIKRSVASVASRNTRRY